MTGTKVLRLLQRGPQAPAIDKLPVVAARGAGHLHAHLEARVHVSALYLIPPNNAVPPRPPHLAVLRVLTGNVFSAPRQHELDPATPEQPSQSSVPSQPGHPSVS
jgi:hypothetical protein